MRHRSAARILSCLALTLIAGCGTPLVHPDATNAGWACPALPPSFEESSLIGEWRAEYGLGVDTLVLADDHTYEQQYTRDTDGFEFQNGPHRWALEARTGGGFFLHLSQMRRCDDTDELCTQLSGGSGERYWFDFCGGEYVQMRDEVILLVSGVHKVDGMTLPPEGVILRHMAINSSSGSYYFIHVSQ